MDFEVDTFNLDVDPVSAYLVGSLLTWSNEGKYVIFVCVCLSGRLSNRLSVCLSVRVVGEGVGGGRQG